MSLNVGLLRASFEQAAPIADKVADKFYELLFSDYPAVQPLFANSNMVLQKRALIGSLVFIVDNLENTDKLLDYLRNMGRRHVNYKAEFPHFEAVGATLLKTFAHFFGTAWTPQLERAWADAYGVIASVMKEGMAQATGMPVPQESSGVIPQEPSGVIPQELSNVVPIAAGVTNSNATSSGSTTHSAATTPPPASAAPVAAAVTLPAGFVDQLRTAVRSEIRAAIQAEIDAIVREEMANLTSVSVAAFLKKAG